jgi:alanyl-tRNA synthetase
MLFSKNSAEEYGYVVSSKCSDIRGLAGKLNETFSGKGGGQPGYVQGKISVSEEARLTPFIEELLQNEI